jgi:hypothetical protein
MTKKYGTFVGTVPAGPSATSKRYTISLIMDNFVRSARKGKKKEGVGSSEL